MTSSTPTPLLPRSRGIQRQSDGVGFEAYGGDAAAPNVSQKWYLSPGCKDSDTRRIQDLQYRGHDLENQVQGTGQQR